MTIARILLAFSICMAAVASAPAVAQTPAPAPSAVPTAGATPAPPSDPCGSIMSIVNRPTIGTGVCTVRTGHFDVETGYTNTDTTGPGGSVTGNYPQGLIRLGTSDSHLDVEVGTPSFNTSNAAGIVTSGWSDLSVGAKYEIGYTSQWVYGVNGVFTVPTGKPAFSAGNAQFTGNFNWGYSINSEFGLAGTLGLNALSAYNAGGQPQSYFAFIPSIMATAALPGGPSELFGEYAYFSQAGPNLGSKSYFDFGYVRDFGPHLQFDVEYGFSPTTINLQKQHYIGAGISFMN
ncbi:MAG TPA: transporter [Candidatus Acidoferrales bacterium]|nr:transporter [Candidatus Acidoferrales bacterium]